MRKTLLMICLFLILGIAMPDASFFLVYPILMAGMLPSTLLSFDEKTGWNTCVRTLPFSPLQLVGSRYLECFCLIVLPVFLEGIGLYLRDGSAAMCPFLFAAGLLGPTIMMPLYYRFGMEKSRYVLLGISGLLAVLATFTAMDLSALSGIRNVSLLLIVLPLFLLSFAVSLCFLRTLPAGDTGT
ncbi:MAG: ABC-2 transporter permease [Clostridia bacterium]|nr:ABC-2 transporter permease [Clostridia bacterium]